MNGVIDELETENVQPEEDNIKVTAARIHNFRSLVNFKANNSYNRN